MQRKPSGGAKQSAVEVIQAADPPLAVQVALRLLQVYVALTIHAAATVLPSICVLDSS